MYKCSSGIVIDNAPYHSRNNETYPVSKWKKQQYIDWLKSKDIAVPKKILRAELWTMCKQERDRYLAKIVESIAKMQDMKLCTSPPPPPPSLRTQSNRNGLGGC